MTAIETSFTFRARIIRAGWVGLSGGVLFGLSEAWTILARNTTASPQTLMGVVPALGFVVALDGALGAVGLSLLGLLIALIPWLHRWLAEARRWTALCVALFVALLAALLGLEQFGVLAGTVRGSRAALFAGVSLGAGVVMGLIAFAVARSATEAQREQWARFSGWISVTAWVIAALMPLAFALFRSR